MNIVGIIPSRYASSRLPGKPLALIGDKPMVQWVYENCKKDLEHVFVATDDQRIYDTVIGFGGKAVMTKENHQSGTDRCAEAVEKIEADYNLKVDVAINIQGDEPFFEAQQLIDIKSAFSSPEVKLATLIKKADSIEQVTDISEAKVILNEKSEAILFSRSPIPFVRNYPQEEWLNHHTFYLHLGIYAYRADALKEIVKLKPSSLELAESLEQLRWIENGIPVKCVVTENDETMCIDTEEDLRKANEYVKSL